MPIVRAALPSDRFTIIRNDLWSADTSLSWRALGLLTYLLGRAPGFTVDSVRLAAMHKEGRDAVRSALSELETAGYLLRRVDHRDRGRLATVTYVTDDPGIWPPGLGPDATPEPSPPSGSLGEALRDLPLTPPPPPDDEPAGQTEDGFSGAGAGSAPPAPDNQAPVNPAPVNPAPTTKTRSTRLEGGERARADAESPTPPPDTNGTEKVDQVPAASRRNPRRCGAHQDDEYVQAPCGACRDARRSFEEQSAPPGPEEVRAANRRRHEELRAMDLEWRLRKGRRPRDWDVLVEEATARARQEASA